MIGGRRALAAIGIASAALLAALLPHAGCSKEGCLANDAACVVPTPCPTISFVCPVGSGTVSAAIIGPNDRVPGGYDALAAAGDVILRNDRIAVVIDALDHPHYLAPTGGTILDLSTLGADNDSINNIFQATGLLPDDAAYYTSLELIDGDGFRAVQVRGHLYGNEEHTIATRYELRACEPGVRVRTELVNASPDAAIWSLTDGWYWGGRDALPFTPFPGAGFEHPDFELTEVGDVFRSVPWMAASGHTLPAASYSVVACNAGALEGFHATTVSAMGTPRRIVPPRDYVVFERFIGVADGNAIAPAAELAYDVRRQLFGEQTSIVRGKIVVEDQSTLAFNENRAAVLISEGSADTPKEQRTPWTEVLPSTDGSFSARVPSGRSYVVEVFAFGRSVVSKELAVEAGAEEVDVGELRLPGTGRVTLEGFVDGRRSEILIFFVPADAATEEATKGKLLGNFTECAPLLGPPHGGSPACNRVLTRTSVNVDVPPGRYHVYGSAGPFASLDRETIEVSAGSTSSLDFRLTRLILAPPGTLSADFHVHGATSFDSSIPDLSRVQAFLASGIDVIAATDHDAVYDYAQAIQELRASSRVVLIPGVETTGHILSRLAPTPNFRA